MILREDLYSFLLLMLQLFKGQNELDNIQKLKQINPGDIDALLIEFKNTYQSIGVDELANCLLVSRTSEKSTLVLLRD